MAKRNLDGLICKSLAVVVLALVSALAIAQPKPPDAGQVLQQSQEPLRLAPRVSPDLVPKLPPPPPALKPQPKLRVTVSRFTFSGNTLYKEATLQEIVKEFIGKSLSFDELNEVATKVRAYHRERGYFLAQAYLPEQAIRDGVVQIAIIEGRVGVVELLRRPASRLSDRLLTGIIGAHLSEGELITETGLERPLLLINDLPTAVVASEIRRSNTIGAADLRVNVDQGDDWLGGYVDFDNQGSRFTGEYRAGASVNLNNPTGMGDQFSFRGFQTSEDLMRYSRLSYLIPVGYYGTRIGVSYTTFDYQLGGSPEFEALKSSGEGTVSSVYGFHPIIRTRNSNVIFQFSYEDKRLIDRIETANFVKDTRISAGKGGLVGDFRDGIFGGGLNAYTVAMSLGQVGIGPPTEAAADNNTAAGGHQTQGDFRKYTGELRRLQRISDSTSLLVALTGQKAGKNLASAEKVSIGGPNAVRAYPVAEGTGDSAYVLQSELRYQVSGVKPLGGDFSVMGFFDYGESKINQRPNASDSPNYRSLAGYGVGASLGKEGNFLVKGSAAWQGDNEVPQADTDKRVPRIWFQLIKYF